ncbi:MAG: type II secretion system protein [bacterium]
MSLRETKLKGFTLLEVLLVIAAISILAGITIIAINPAKQFAEMNNANRQTDIKVISDAVYQYTIRHHGATPPGVDTTLRVIGTADSGCDIGCGQHFVQNEQTLFQYAAQIVKQKIFAIAAPPVPEELTTPQFVSATIDPIKVVPGDIMRITAHITDASGISSVNANMGNIDTIDLSLIEGTKFEGTWETTWRVHDTEPIYYTTTITATNLHNISNQTELSWMDPPASGWVLPIGYQDPGSQWTTETLAYDNNTGTYATNTYGSAGLGQFIVFTLTNPITSDRIRVNADYLNSDINYVDIDVYLDGAWTDVFQGGDESTWNCQWVELTFPKGTVTQARFRYNYKVGGFWYWLYEFQFYQTVPVVTLPTCNTQNATAIQENAAILHGLVLDDGGEPVQYRFQYGTTTGYGTDTAWTGSKQTSDSFNEVISDLATDTPYHFHGQVRNSAGTADCQDNSFTTKAVGTGWVLPTGFDDPAGKWENETQAYDDNTITYARSYHNIGDPQWSEFLYFDHLPMFADHIQFYARGGAEVSTIDVDVYKDDLWTHVYEGPFSDKQWVEQNFTEGTVSQARIRFYATSINTGFYWELNEFNYYKTSEANASACIDLTPSLVSDYIVDIPYDPKDGNAERTYYAIKKDSGGRIVIYACSTELGEEISISR